MAIDDEDDYLSDKFLLQSAAAGPSAKPLTYAERRKQAQRQSEIKNAQNKAKSRRIREAEALEQGLSQNLFERAKAEEQESGAKNKAMSMMLRMGFKPGKSLGRSEDDEASKLDTPGSATPTPPPISRSESPLATNANANTEAHAEISEKKDAGTRHRTAPLAIDIWSGKKGVGLGKRAPSPDTAERASKVAKLEEESSRETFRSRAREAFEERRILGRLTAASRTLATLDEKSGIQFNILSLDPREPETFPKELMEALSALSEDEPVIVASLQAEESEPERLRKQMQMDALLPLETSPDGDSDEDGATELPKKDTPVPLSLSKETINEAREFLQLDAQERLKRVLHYLREKYHYCFWCGTQYNDKSDLDGNCPGEDEEAHD